MILTVTRRRIRCDVCETSTASTANNTTRPELRRWAKTRGWTRVAGKDRCGRCSAGAP